MNVAGCDSVHTYNVTINNSTANTTSVTACGTYTWICNGTTYTTSGTYTCTSTNASGCLHTETLALTITTTTNATLNATACDTYTWSCNGTTYTVGGIYTCTSTSGNCTTLTTLNLTINNSSTMSTSQTACDTYTWSCNGTVYTTSGTYTCTSINGAGCVNTATLNLTVNYSTSNTVTVGSCGLYTWSCNGVTYASTGIYTCTSLNVAGCLHTETLNLNVSSAPLVSGLNMTNITGVTAVANWTASPGAAWYELRYKPTTSASSAFISASIIAPNTSKSISGLTPNTQYDIQIRSFCSQNTVGSWSGVINFTTPLTCGTPTGLAISAITSTTATASWTAVSGAQYYNVRYKITSGSTWTTVTSTANSKGLTGLVGGSTYEVQVATICAGITSSYSSSVIFNTVAPCGTPTGLVVTNISNTASKLNWNAVSGAGYYNVRWKAVAASVWTSGTSILTNKAITGLTAGTQYEFQVQAICGSTPGSYSTSTLWTTTTSTPPVVIGNVIGKVINTEEVLNSSVNIYPNPTTDILNIDLSVMVSETTTIRLLDMSGRVVKEVKMKSEKGVNTYAISLNELTNGIYALQVFENETLTHVSKIQKK